MSNTQKRFRRRDDEDGNVPRKSLKPHITRLHEKHIRNCLRSPHLIDQLVEEDEDL